MGWVHPPQGVSMPLLGIESIQAFADPIINCVSIKFDFNSTVTAELTTESNQVTHIAPWGTVYFRWQQSAGNRNSMLILP